MGQAKETICIDLDVAVPMRDGVMLRADVYRPSGGDECFPVLLERTPYGKHVYQLSGTTLDPLTAVRAGYAVVIQDVRGRFASQGVFQPFAKEGLDGYDSVEWCAMQQWSTGTVGMYGNSYMAAAALHAAAMRPPHLVAVYAGQGSADYYEGRSYRGGAFEFGSLASIALLALLPGTVRNLPTADRRRLVREAREAIDHIENMARTLPLEALKGTAVGVVAPFLFEWMEHDTFDNYWAEMSLEPHYAHIDIPVMHVTSWFDPYLSGTLKNYLGLVNHGKKNQHLMIGPWTHTVPLFALLGTARVGELNCGLGASVNFDHIQLSWFDAWLNEGSVSKKTPPSVRYFVMGENTWRESDSWPPPNSTESKAFLVSAGRANSLGGDGQLVVPGHSASYSAATDTYQYDPHDPVPTCGGSHVMVATSHPPGAYDQSRIELRPDVLVYTSDELDVDLEVTGLISAELFVASSAVDTDFTAKLVDVWWDGRALNVCDGILRLGFRHGFIKRTHYEPNTCCRISIAMGATSHVFRAGHRIRLELSSSNFPRFDRNLNTGRSAVFSSELVSARQTVFHSPDRPSHLLVSGPRN